MCRHGFSGDDDMMQRFQALADRPNALGHLRLADRRDGPAVSEQVAERPLLGQRVQGHEGPARTYCRVVRTGLAPSHLVRLLGR